MLKKIITYADFDGNERTETLYFNMTQAELVAWEMSEYGGLSKTIEKLTSEQDLPKIILLVQTIIAKSYGEKSADGRYFAKTKEALDKFMATEAYSILFMELATDAASATAFVNGIKPRDNPPPKPQ